ncbi:MAG TPA: hypothetical protein VGR31_02740 [Planctomycetota bacterium]|jgi:hypothetical protein|nr:hypothetical protein [Planctomycetota bacterium]
MSEGLRWKLVVGCLLLAVLEAPESALVVIQDLRGPWRIETPPTLHVAASDAPVVSKERLVLDRNHPFPIAPRDVAVLFAR